MYVRIYFLFITVEYYIYRNYKQYAFDTVDTITKPAFVVPNSCEEADYFRRDERLQKNMVFTSIPLQFFFRDRWSRMDDSEVKFKNSAYDNAKTDEDRLKIVDSLVKKNPVVTPAAPMAPPQKKRKKAVVQEEEEEEEEVTEEEYVEDDDNEDMRDEEDLQMIDRALDI